MKTILKISPALRVKEKCCICKEPATAILNNMFYCRKCYNKEHYKLKLKNNLIKSRKKNKRKKNGK